MSHIIFEAILLTTRLQMRQTDFELSNHRNACGGFSCARGLSRKLASDRGLGQGVTSVADDASRPAC